MVPEDLLDVMIFLECGVRVRCPSNNEWLDDMWVAASRRQLSYSPLRKAISWLWHTIHYLVKSSNSWVVAPLECIYGTTASTSMGNEHAAYRFTMKISTSLGLLQLVL